VRGILRDPLGCRAPAETVPVGAPLAPSETICLRDLTRLAIRPVGEDLAVLRIPGPAVVAAPATPAEVVALARIWRG